MLWVLTSKLLYFIAVRISFTSVNRLSLLIPSEFFHLLALAFPPWGLLPLILSACFVSVTVDSVCHCALFTFTLTCLSVLASQPSASVDFSPSSLMPVHTSLSISSKVSLSVAVLVYKGNVFKSWMFRS